MILYHYTCVHSMAKLAREADPWGVVRLEPLSPGGLLWCTDLDTPIREALGLTSMILKCDRTEFRLSLLDASTVRRWVDVRREYPELWDLEKTPGAMPMHWYVSSSPERATLTRAPTWSPVSYGLATGDQPQAHYAPG